MYLNIKNIKKAIYHFNKPIQCIFFKREKRFISYFHTNDNNILIAHCINTGKMEGLLVTQNSCIISCKNSGKLKYTWEIVNVNNQWIGVNTFIPNKLVEQMLNNHLIPNEIFKKEKLFKDLRYKADFSNDKYIIEVKNVHLVYKENNINVAYFPDCPTLRGAKQMDALIKLQQEGKNIIIIYIIQRDDVDILKINKNIDINYYNKCIEAKNNNIKFYAFNCKINTKYIKIHKSIKVILDF